MENDVQRYIQVRDEIQDEIKKIGPSVERLHEITKRFIAHFDVFKEMSSQTGNIIASEIKNASQEMAQRVAAEFLDRIETIPQEAVSRLNQSIAHADRQLKQVKSSNFKRNILTLVISHLFILSIGFGAGYLYNKRTTYVLDESIFEEFYLESVLKKAFPKLSPQERRRLEKLSHEQIAKL